MVPARHTRIPPTTFYGGHDPLDAPRYSIAAVARYVRVPASTVTWWVRGREVGGYAPVIERGTASRLSFLDLVEIDVLKTLRRVHKVQLPKIRDALHFAEHKLGVTRLLLREDLASFGGGLLIEHLGTLVDLSRHGQIAMKRIIEAHLLRIERDPDTRPSRLFPSFSGITDERPVAIDARVGFGRPIVAGTSVHTAVIATRADAGETVDEIADDYGFDRATVEWALVYESVR